MDWKIRPYHPYKDEETVVRFHLELMREHYWDRILVENEVGRCWAEELAKRVGQHMDIRQDPHRHHRSGYINEIFLEPAYRGCGWAGDAGGWRALVSSAGHYIATSVCNQQ
ncbi:hypothetical protein [Desmospora activa]|uniref:hypothetical protein n=1 Tax=Desmospora activa TaxID=500615 RepID=UPI001FE77E69|nr:hypothetical protein [Desmospora activa]